MLVKVRGKLLDGLDAGWYTDAQGTITSVILITPISTLIVWLFSTIVQTMDSLDN